VRYAEKREKTEGEKMDKEGRKQKIRTAGKEKK
jgi:hypothetical protein